MKNDSEILVHHVGRVLRGGRGGSGGTQVPSAVKQQLLAFLAFGLTYFWMIIGLGYLIGGCFK